MLLAAATLVKFSGFQDVNEVIFNVVSARCELNQYHYDPKSWKIYVKYRQLLSDFLTDQRRSGALFVGPVHYLKLAKYFLLFLTAPTNIPGEFLTGK